MLFLNKKKINHNLEGSKATNIQFTIDSFTKKMFSFFLG